MKNNLLLIIALLFCISGLGQNKIIDQLLDRPVVISVHNGDTFLSRDLTDYLNVTLGRGDDSIAGIESDVYTNLAVLRKYFMRPHPSVSTTQKYFIQASKEFGVPVSLLMVIGQVENNWTQTGPTIDQGWGIMHLVQNSFCNTLSEAAQLVGLSEQVLKDDALQNIRGAAALIAKYAGEEREKFRRIEDWYPAVARFSGLVSPQLRDLQAKNYFETLSKGIEAKTVWGENIHIESEKISFAQLDRGLSNNVNGGLTSRVSSPDYSPALFNSAANCNYATGRANSIDTWVNHWIATGTYLGTISWFQTCPCPSGTCPSNCPGNYRGCNGSSPIGASSAHFVIKNSNGEITQMVAVANTAYHCGASGFAANNPRSIGVEHEATAANPGMWNSAPMLSASATMACYFKQQFGFPTTQNASPGICGHNDMPGTSTTCPGSIPWSTWFSYFTGACSVSPPSCNNDNSCSPMTLSINSAGNCVSTGCSSVNATPPSPDIPFLGASSCTSPYQSGRYDDDVWFSITTSSAPSPITIRATPTTNTGNFDVVIGLYQGNCSNPTQVSCADLFGVGVTENLSFTPQANTTYLIRVFSYGIGSTFSGNFNICVFGNSQPDLTITAGTQTVSLTTVTAGNSITASCSEDNSGSSAAGANHVTLWLSSDNILNTGNDTYLGQIAFPSLPASSNSLILSSNITIPAATCAGNYYLFFWADGNQVVAESNESNNFASRQITVNAAVLSNPSSTTASNISSTGFQANWNSVIGATSYRLDVSTNSSFSSYVPGYQDLNTGNVIAYSVIGLTCNTNYFYRVRANNTCGTSLSSGTITATTSACCTAPSTPASASASSITQTTFQANWNLVAGATSYRIDVSANSSFSSYIAGYQDLNAGNVSSVIVSGLVCNTNYYYRIRAVNICLTSVNSNTISLSTSVCASGCVSPLVTTPPANQSVTVPSAASFSITADGSANLYQWQVNNGTGWNNLSNASPYGGVTSTSLSINPTNAGMNGYQYRCVVTSSCTTNSAVSATAILTVGTGCVAPAISTHPVNQIVVAPNQASFSIVAAGSANIYQWQFNAGAGWTNLSNGSPYAGVNTPTLSISSTNGGMNGYQYRCVVSSSCSGIAATSNIAVLTINVSCAAPTTQATINSAIPGSAQISLDLISGNGNRRLVKINTINNFTDPVNGTDPVANTNYGGSGEQVVFNGNGTNLVVTGLQPSTNYCFRVYEASCSGASSVYNLTNLSTFCQSTTVVTAIPPVSGLEEFKIMPNPNRGTFIVSMKLNSLKEVHYRLINMLGQTIYESVTYRFTGVQTMDIDVNRATPGYYLLETRIGKEFFSSPVVITR
jgi:N-acetylmuramoyl-L-alanine amidase/CARDB